MSDNDDGVFFPQVVSAQVAVDRGGNVRVEAAEHIVENHDFCAAIDDTRD